MRTDILVTTEEGQVVAGSIIWQNGSLQVEANKEYVQLMRNVLQKTLVINGQLLELDDDPVRWLQALPYYYTGSRLRAAYYDA